MWLRISSLILAILVSQPCLLQADGRKIALLVGINKYNHSELNNPTPLQHAENDVIELAAELKKAGYETTVLTGKTATLKSIREKLDSLRRLPGDGGIFLIAFAGHGMEPDKGEPYYCPFDADQRIVPPDAVDRFPWDPKTLLPLAEVLESLKVSSASSRLMLVDACRNDPSSPRGRGVGARMQLGDLPENSAILLSCNKGQRAYENSKWENHGAFFYQVLLAIRKNKVDSGGKITVDSIWDHVKNSVPTEVDKVIKGGAQQNPWRLVRGDVDLRLAVVTKPTEKINSEGTSNTERPPPKVIIDTREAKSLELIQENISSSAVQAAQNAWAAKYGVPASVSVDVDGMPMKFSLIPPGRFVMGGQRSVTLSKPFYISVHEVKQAEFEAITLSNPSLFQKSKGVERISELVKVSSTDSFPVERVNRDDAEKFANKLQGRSQSQFPDYNVVTRLPTEAEWEFAARAGVAKGMHQNGKAQLGIGEANFDSRLRRTSKCGDFAPNAFGLFDVHGNVAEWCEDTYRPVLDNSNTVDPLESVGASDASALFVVRGGSWEDDARRCSLSYRTGKARGDSESTIGFRVVIALKAKK